ncbi:MAG: substrate-binding domain-containing protein, partial [Chloroflexi bacterium]|nr:substrate-binding domain-containing protein [Chloroflexota bacterium]
DLSVVGFDDLPFTAFTDPPLTTVHQPVQEKGEEAARMLLEGIADAGSAPRRKVLETRLVLRASTAPATAVGSLRQEVMAHA